MKSSITKSEVRKLVGKRIYALKKDGTRVTGILREIRGNKLLVEPVRNPKKASTNWFIIPLILFELLVISTTCFWARPFCGPVFGPGFGGPGFGGSGFGGLGSGFRRRSGLGFGRSFDNRFRRRSGLGFGRSFDNRHRSRSGQGFGGSLGNRLQERSGQGFGGSLGNRHQDRSGRSIGGSLGNRHQDRSGQGYES